MAEHWVHPNTALNGFSNCGLMMCGIEGVIEIPDGQVDPIPGIDREIIPFRIYINNVERTNVFVKGSLQWTMTIDDAVSSCAFDLYGYQPNLYESIVITIGVSNTILWRGMILNTSSSYIGGNVEEETHVYQYSIDGVSHEFVFSRKFISMGFNADTYAGTIVRKIYNKYIKPYSGYINSGYKYENPVKYENEDIMSIFQKLASASDCYFYIDPRSGQFYFMKSGNAVAPIHMTYETSKNWDIDTNKWGFPRNNYHGASVSKDASNVATKVVIHGKKAVKHTITNYGQEYLNDNDELKGGSSNEEYFVITEGQKTFFTPKPIYAVEKIEADWTLYLPNLNAPWLGPLEKQKTGTWYNPMGSGHPLHLSGSNYLRNVDQWYKILGVSPEDLVDEEGNPIDDADAYYKKSSRGFWENLLNLDEPPTEEAHLWRKETAAKYCNWELRPELSNRSVYEPAISASEDDDYTPAFSFEVAYDSNTVTFTAPIETGIEEFKMAFKKVKITYYEMVDEVYTYNHGNRHTYAARSGTDGIFELHIEDDSIFEKSIASKYANRIFELHSIADISASYSYYIYGLDIINDRIYTGMKQTVSFHGGTYYLMIDSISWSVVSIDPLVFKVDVGLGTKIRDLSQLLADVLS